ncbi:MAG: STAS domain-containing protein [Sedimentisphaerales bacterium]|nr:STAS domain-containing protein [Sedimentisphaerales bacterium]
MVTQEQPGGVILVYPSTKADIDGELYEALQLSRQRGDCDVIVDCAALDIMSSHHLASLLRIQKLLQDCGHQLILCCVREVTQRIFSVTGLTDVFDMVGDRSEAMARVEAGGGETIRSEPLLGKGPNT